MKNRIIATSLFLILFLFSTGSDVFAHGKIRSGGIGVRGTFWGTADQRANILLNRYDYLSVSSEIGGGGWLYFLSRSNEHLLVEFGLGAIGVAVNEYSGFFNDDVDVSAVIPVTFGFRVQPLSARSHSSLQPYFSMGGGPYWLADIRVRENYFEEEVKVHTVLKPGVYAGGGMDFLLSSWFGFNFDVKYHVIDFDVDHERTGFEYGIGIQFMWGRYRSHRR